MANKQVVKRINNLILKAHRCDQAEFYQLQHTFLSVSRPTETQCASFVSTHILYQTLWDITRATIRARLEAYMASPLADLTSPICVPICQDSIFHQHFKHDTKQHKHVHHVAIAHLSLSSFLDAYKYQVKMSKFDQNVWENWLCVMTQLSKTLCYCNKTSTDILFSSLSYSKLPAT